MDRLSQEELDRLNHLQRIFDQTSQKIADAELEYIERTYGKEKLVLWMERASLRQKPFLVGSEVGQRVKYLDEHLKDIIDLLGAI
ncbi:hypothetical protein [Flavobacterium filum]|uniref:hypothetical protein n=1 Tax=Flavobacterium filum TaxID=370974 RepID=UPI0023F2A2CC|nr:hypothetical protein [Flavobacterium filum]